MALSKLQPVLRSKKIYLDYNATTPVDERVVEVMLPYFTQQFGNASSSQHSFGWDAEEAVEKAREQVAAMVGAKAKEVYFTSGATEAINIVLQGYCKKNSHQGDHIITCKTEHKAVLDTCAHLEAQGFEVTYLQVDPAGNIDINQLKDAIKDNTLLICLMHANNETGLIHPLEEISAIAAEKQVAFFTDASQSAGKIPLNLNAANVDFAAFSAHKLYGPKGVGALYIKSESRSAIDPLFYGGGQEKSLRPGTLNVPGIIGFGKACELAGAEMAAEAEKLSSFIHSMEQEIIENTEVTVNSVGANRLPHMTNLTFQNIDGSHLMRSLKNLAVSQGSACTSSILEPSHVLLAMGHTPELALSSIRIGLGRQTFEEEVRLAMAQIIRAVEQLKLTTS